MKIDCWRCARRKAKVKCWGDYLCFRCFLIVCKLKFVRYFKRRMICSWRGHKWEEVIIPIRISEHKFFEKVCSRCGETEEVILEKEGE